MNSIQYLKMVLIYDDSWTERVLAVADASVLFYCDFFFIKSHNSLFNSYVTSDCHLFCQVYNFSSPFVWNRSRYLANEYHFMQLHRMCMADSCVDKVRWSRGKTELRFRTYSKVGNYKQSKRLASNSLKSSIHPDTLFLT